MESSFFCYGGGKCHCEGSYLFEEAGQTHFGLAHGSSNNDLEQFVTKIARKVIAGATNEEKRFLSEKYRSESFVANNPFTVCKSLE